MESGIKLCLRGRLIRTAAIFDEEWQDPSTIPSPEILLQNVKSMEGRADVLTFAQPITDSHPRYPYKYEMENAAVIPVTSYSNWWNALSQESRRNVRVAQKRGVVVKECCMDEAFTAGISAIYNESPVRQGRRFWHYGKSLQQVKEENSTYLNRSFFVGAYFEEVLIGFLKIVKVGNLGSIMQVICRTSHFDKKATNALVAKGVEICEQNGLSHLVYCAYTYNGNQASQLTEFKRRNGFVRLDYPRYFVPLTMKGSLGIRFRYYRGPREILPTSLLQTGLKLRSWYYARCADRHIAKNREAQRPRVSEEVVTPQQQ